MNLTQTPIFAGLNEKQVDFALEQLRARKREFPKGSFVFHAGKQTREFGLVLYGRVQIESCDFWGNRTILDSLGAGQVFAETYALTGTPMMVDAVAVEKSTVLLLSATEIFRGRGFGTAETRCLARITQNLLAVSAEKNLRLSRRIFCTSPRTIRGRLLSYLSQCAAVAQKNKFDIPFDRQQLADYLNVDRSALSTELGKMRADGLLDFWKNHFRLLQKSATAGCTF